MKNEELNYTESHEWIEPEGEIRAMGITGHAAHLLGDIVYTELPEVGTAVRRGDEIIVVESPKAAADVYAPLSGEIVEVNGALETDPATINRDPHGEGWLVRIRPSDPSEAERLLSWQDYQNLTGG